MTQQVKKDMSAEMAKEYIPKAVESGWYKWWEHAGYFKPAARSPDAKKFVIILPPPNVTGHLHLGHALTGAVEDSLVRYHRMKGDETLFVPGTDHAGIATQVVVEKRLKAETGKTRHDFGREEFLKHAWRFKEAHATFIKNQVELIGLSMDWTRERFTLDEVSSAAVREAFVKLHEDGKIYRATRLVNWCCALQSAISDVEVDTDEIEPNTKLTVPGYDRRVDVGQLTHVAYKIAGTDGEEIVIATTRPETILGDTAVAVHPEDPRYKKYHGMKVICPFRDEQIPIVLDAKLVKMEFGTGAVKITPAHDFNDFECGKRHNLPQINILDEKGFIAIAGEFHGMHRFAARYAVTKALEEKGLLRGVEGHAMTLSRCSRTGDIIEPMLMPQWYVDCSEMAAAAIDAAEKGELKIIPEHHKIVWNHWLKDIQPWCVSRQLWWGHRIPAYRVELNGTPLGTDHEEGAWVVARNTDEAKRKAAAKFKLSDADADKLVFHQDPDVLDTWFSSGLWPFSTLRWPEDNDDFRRFFPNSLLETGHDILFFWVARMVMLSLHFHKQLPFKEVFLHAMVRDKDGRKMSKSLGNVIDPLYVLHGITLEKLHESVTQGNLDPKEVPKAIKFQKEAFPNGIPECGSDALRFGLLSYTSSGRSVNLDIERIVGYRQFCNKLWNVVRFVLFFSLGSEYKPVPVPPKDQLPLECQWILSRLDACAAECNLGFSEGSYDFALTTNSIYRFWLYELCDVFIELTKPIMQRDNADARKQVTQAVLFHAVEAGLRLLHPMMPFVTEELWHRLPNYNTFPVASIMIAGYPQPSGYQDETVEARMKVIQETVHSLRSIKASYNLTNKTRPNIILQSSEAFAALLQENLLAIQTLAVVGDISVAPLGTPVTEEGAVPTVISGDITANVLLKGMIDVAKEVAKLEKTAAMLAKSKQGIEDKQKAANYEQKVPEAVRVANEQKRVDLEKELAQTLASIETLKKLA